MFGIAGLSMIVWVSIIALWHTYMFPRFFQEDQVTLIKTGIGLTDTDIRLKPSGLIDRSKYSNKSFVIADFNPVQSSYGVNRLYTSMLLSLGVMSFLLITYGLHSGLSQLFIQ